MSMSASSRDYDRFDQLAEEFAERYRRGERPSLEEYVSQRTSAEKSTGSMQLAGGSKYAHKCTNYN
jgi:hypothetical protein